MKDAKNAFYWRFDRRRLSAEEIRDWMLEATGQLDPNPAGPHAFPARASYVFTQHNPFLADFEKLSNTKRSVYLFQQRFRPNPYLDLFDGADANSVTAARTASTTALQARYVMNNPFVEAQAGALAARVAVSEETGAGRIRLAYLLLYGRVPTAIELQMARSFLQRYGSEVADADLPAHERARSAWTGLMRVLLSSNEFFYVD